MSQDISQSEGATQEQALAQLERQIERGGLFTHTIVSRNADRIEEAEAFLYGVIDLLVRKGILSRDEVLDSAKKIREEMEEKGQTIGPGIALRIDGDGVGQEDFVPVNCSERLHICKAVCCRLSFALSAAEVESGRIKWDLGSPYYIRQESTGCCTHLDPETKRCGIYDCRPSVCRRYSCAKDERIWKDFDRMILNQEWLDEHLCESVPRLLAAKMVPEGIVAQRPSPESEIDAPDGGPEGC
jgi:Fe-S-cluster containining protein